MTRCTAVQILQCPQAHPGGMTCPRQRHIQFSQILTQPFRIGCSHDFVIRAPARHQSKLTIRIMPAQQRIPCLHRAHSAEERQEHQRILQPLGLVHRHHAHPGIVTFQPLAARLTLAFGGIPLLLQITHQGVLALQAGGCLLQQLAQMQQIGQLPLAPLRQQAGHHAKILQHVTNHRQHALAAPDLPVALELRHPLFPVQLVMHQPLQLQGIQPAQGGTQCRTQQPSTGRLGRRLQPAQQRRHHRTGIDRLILGQIDATDTLGTQGLSDGIGLPAAVDQHGDVGRPHARNTARIPLIRMNVLFVRTHRTGKTGLALGPRLQQARDLPCRDLGIMRGIGSLGYMARLGIQPVSGIFRHRPGDQCRRSPARIRRVLPDFLAPLSLHRQERQRHRCCCTIPVIRYGTEPECPPRALLGHLEDMVDGAHHGFRRAEIGVQRVVPSSGGLARPQIGMNVGPPEGIDGLLRVADQDQRLLRAVLLHPIDTVEDAVLHRIGILEFIDHRYRKLRPDPFGQPLSTL